MTKILILDTETTGLLPKKNELNNDNLLLFPHVVQFSYIIYDTNISKILKIVDCIIKIPENINISEEVSNIHGITNEISQNSKYKMYEVLNNVISDYLYYNVDLIVGHNLSFDINMLKVELMREINSDLANITNKNNCSIFLNNLNETGPNSPKLYCTMQKTITLCNLKIKSRFGREYLKFPKLNELHIKLFNSSPKNLHNSLNDVLICLRCYYMLEYIVDIVEIDNEIKILLSELI